MDKQAGYSFGVSIRRSHSVEVPEKVYTFPVYGKTCRKCGVDFTTRAKNHKPLCDECKANK